MLKTEQNTKTMMNIENAKRVLIFSGEGENGTYEEYTGKRSARAIKSALTRERCSGDRWASLWISGDDDYADDTYLEVDETNMDLTGDMRTIDDDEID